MSINVRNEQHELTLSSGKLILSPTPTAIVLMFNDLTRSVTFGSKSLSSALKIY